MAAIFSVVIVGPGRLGRHVAEGLRCAGYPVTLVGKGEGIPPAAVTWFTVPDGAVAAASAAAPAGCRLHSAGALEATVLGERAAVLHPLMTFPPPAGARVFATLDGEPEACRLATVLASALGWTVLGPVNDRVRYHAAASLVSGHAGALFLDAVQLLTASTGMGEAAAAEALLSLCHASLENVAARGAEAITGPAARGDLNTVEAHRSALPPSLLPVYDFLTERILALRG